MIRNELSYVDVVVKTVRQMNSVFELYLKDEFNVKNIKYDKWLALNNFICFNAMLKCKGNNDVNGNGGDSNNNICMNLLLNMKYYILFNMINVSMCNDVHSSSNNNTMRFSENIITNFFEKIIECIAEDNFNYNDVNLHQEFLTTMLIVVLAMKSSSSSSLFTSDQIISVKKYIKTLYEILSYKKGKIKYLNIFLIIKTLLHIAFPHQKTILKNTKHLSIHKATSFHYVSVSPPKPTTPPNINTHPIHDDIYKHILNHNTTYLIDNSAYGPGRSIHIMVEDYYHDKLSLLTPLKYHNYISHEYFNLTAIGSTSLGLRASTTKNLDLVYLPNPKNLPYGKIEYLANYLKTYYLGDKGFNTNAMDISYLSQGIIVLESYCRIHIWNVRYLTANKKCKELLKNEQSSFKKQIVFLYEMFRHLCFPRRKHILFLYIAYLDCYYKVFDRSKRVFEIGRYASYEGNGKFSYLYERFYHYRFNNENLKYAEDSVDVRTHLVKFCGFVCNLVECCDNASDAFDKVPFEFHDGRYLFNLISEMKLIVDKVERTDKAGFVNKMKVIVEWVKAYSFLDYNQFFEKVNALVNK